MNFIKSGSMKSIKGPCMCLLHLILLAMIAVVLLIVYFKRWKACWECETPCKEWHKYVKPEFPWLPTLRFRQ